MAEWIDVVAKVDLPSGSSQTLTLDGLNIAVFNVDGHYYAVEDRCSHDNGTLSEGMCEGPIITCPRHGARFSLETGEALSPPAYEAIATFPVRIEKGMVQVQVQVQED